MKRKITPLDQLTPEPSGSLQTTAFNTPCESLNTTVEKIQMGESSLRIGVSAARSVLNLQTEEPKSASSLRIGSRAVANALVLQKEDESSATLSWICQKC